MGRVRSGRSTLTPALARRMEHARQVRNNPQEENMDEASTVLDPESMISVRVIQFYNIQNDALIRVELCVGPE